MKLELHSGVRVEEIGGEAIVLDRRGAEVHRVSGDSLVALRLVIDGVDAADVPAQLAEHVTALTEAGVVASTGWSRRKLLLAGGVATAGITTFALATPAAAYSGCPGTIQPDKTPKTYTASGTFTTGPGVTSVVVRAWGGGGYGAASAAGNGGGGGGGGAYQLTTINSLTACTAYNVVVGAGGTSATPTGGSSNFNGSGAAAGGAGGTAGGAGGAGGTGTRNGGAGASQQGNFGGGGGGGAGSDANGTTATTSTGGAGGGTTYPGGAGGQGSTSSAGNGAAPVTFPSGGGGGSGKNSAIGGNGARGQVIVS